MTIPGSEGVRRALVETLQSKLASELQALEEELTLKSGTLSSSPHRPEDTGLFPKFIAPHEMPELDLNHMPSVLCLSDGISRSALIDRRTAQHVPNSVVPPDGEIYRRVYALRLFVYVMAQGFDKTSLARDRLEVAIWRTLWNNRVAMEDATIDVDSYSVLYSDVEKVGAGSMISGFQAKVSVIRFETLATPIEGQADTIETKVEHLGWTPAWGGQ